MARTNRNGTNTGPAFMKKSNQSRPATGGNKNVVSRARRTSAMSQQSSTAGVFARTHTGPYLGKRSV